MKKRGFNYQAALRLLAPEKLDAYRATTRHSEHLFEVRPTENFSEVGPYLHPTGHWGALPRSRTTQGPS